MMKTLELLPQPDDGNNNDNNKINNNNNNNTGSTFGNSTLDEGMSMQSDNRGILRLPIRKYESPPNKGYRPTRLRRWVRKFIHTNTHILTLESVFQCINRTNHNESSPGFWKARV